MDADLEGKKIQLYKYLRQLCDKELEQFIKFIGTISLNDNVFNEKNEINKIYFILHEIKFFDKEKLENIHSKFIKNVV